MRKKARRHAIGVISDTRSSERSTLIVILIELTTELLGFAFQMSQISVKMWGLREASLNVPICYVTYGWPNHDVYLCSHISAFIIS